MAHEIQIWKLSLNLHFPLTPRGPLALSKGQRVDGAHETAPRPRRRPRVVKQARATRAEAREAVNIIEKILLGSKAKKARKFIRK